jgi:glycosyltransferase involved in cell wall biosynthesis
VRVLVVTTVHTPLDARIHHRQIRALLRAGVEVSYAAPWRATGIDPARSTPGVRTFDLPRSVGRRRGRAIAAARALVREVGPGVDLVLLHDPELVLAVLGQRRRLPPIVMDVHEDLVGSLPDRPWVPAALRPVVGRAGSALERWAERQLHLILAEDAYRDRFARPHPVVPNLPWLPLEIDPPGTYDRVVYIGRLSRGRGVHELCEVGRRLGAAGGPQLELVGTPDADVVASVERAHAHGDIRWHGFLPNEAALDVARGAVAGLSLLHDLPNYRGSMPTKIAEYLSLGIPAITTPLPIARQLVEQTGAGVVVPFGDVEAVVEAVLGFARDPDRRHRSGQAGRQLAEASLSWDAVAPQFVEYLRAVAGRAR